MSTDYKSIRRDFLKGELSESDLTGHPADLLRMWYGDAVQAGVPDANAMALSTMGQDGYPAGRIVLMRDLTLDGISFFTNYNSHKGLELAANPRASLLFYWPGLERQARVTGNVSKLSSGESDAYFRTRPRESQIGAWASPQSQVLGSREDLERAVTSFVGQFAERAEVPRPPHWGGYRLEPLSYEFWQGRESRLHDRLKAKCENGGWTWHRLAP